MAIAFVIGTTKQNNGNFTTSAIDTTGADLIILSLTCSHGASASYVASISDSKGNAWLNTGGIFQVDGSNNADSTIVYCINPTVGSGHTFSTTGAGGLLQSMCVGAYSGANSGFDSVHSGGSSLASFTVQPGSVTPNQNNSLVMVCGTAVQIAPTLSVDSGFTIRENQPLVAGQTYGSWIMDLFQGTAAAINPTITSNLNANGMGALTFVFKGAGTSQSVNLSGVAGTSGFGTLVADASATFALSGVSGTAAVGSLTETTTGSSALIGVGASGAAGSFIPSASSGLTLTGVSGTGHAGSFGLSTAIPLSGVYGTGQVGSLFPVTDFLNVPITVIMNSKPIPNAGVMVVDPVPNTAALPYQVPLECILNKNPIPMSGTMMNVPVPGEGSVP